MKKVSVPFSMKSAVLYGPGDIRVEERRVPALEEDKVLIKVDVCGICGTDLLLYKGAVPGTFPYHNVGHEYSGTAVETGSRVKHIAPGDRVVVNPNYWCGECFFCLRDAKHLCINRTKVKAKSNGGFSEYAVVSGKMAHRIPGTLAFDAATFVEPLSCCLHAADMLDVKKGTTAAVLGGGTMGLLMLQLMKLKGCASVLLSEPLKTRRDAARALGADAVVDPLKEHLHDAVKRFADFGADMVIDCAGVPAAIEETFKIARAGGTILFVALSDEKLRLKLDHPAIVRKELNIRGSIFGGSTHDEAIRLLANGKVNVKPIITHKLPLGEIKKAFQMCLEGKAIKALIVP